MSANKFGKAYHVAWRKKQREKKGIFKDSRPFGLLGEFKVCRTCKISKAFSDYYKNKQNTDGRQGECNVCLCRRSAVYSRANAVRVYARQKEWRANNKERVKKNDKRWWAKHPELRRAKNHRKYLAVKQQPDWRLKRQILQRRTCRELTDGYIARLLSKYNNMKCADIPDSLIKAKRLNMLISRQLKQMEQTR